MGEGQIDNLGVLWSLDNKAGRGQAGADGTPKLSATYVGLCTQLSV